MRQRWAWTIRSWWTSHRETILRLAIGFMAILALEMLGGEFGRLVWGSGDTAAIDLRIYHDLVHRWFTGEPVYSQLEMATYPPASYVILWPLVGWLAVTSARWLWAVIMVAALGWMVYLIVQESGADTSLERVFVALMLIAMNATGVTIGIGQLIVFLSPMLMAGLLLLQWDRRGWCKDLMAAAMLLVTLVKPSISVPFFSILLSISGKLRPILLIAFGYLVLTLFAAKFQEPELWTLIHYWLARGSEMATWKGYGNLHAWLTMLGLEEWILPASLLILAALGSWTYRHRHQDFWLLLGVVALVARLWAYHQLYDGLLILFPMVTLFRITKRGPTADGGDVVAGVLLAFTTLAMLVPTRLYYSWPSPWPLLFTSGHEIIWIVVLAFLLDRARRDRIASLVDEVRLNEDKDNG